MNQMFYKMLEGEWIENKYYLKKMLGAGGFGAVFRADEVLRDRVLREVAVKVIPPLPDAKQQEQQLNELMAAVNLNCPYLLRCFSAGEFDFAKSQFLYLVMEQAELSLEQRLEQGSLSVAQVQPMLKQIASGLDYLHREQQKVHRDLKPGNILWVRNSWVISDFGLVRKLGTESYAQTVNPMGTVAYMPPEAFDGKISTAWDIWSLGILIIATLNDGSIPYQFKDETELLKRVMNGELQLPTLPSKLEKIVLGCLQRDHKKRWTAQEMLATLNKEKFPSLEVPQKTFTTQQAASRVKNATMKAEESLHKGDFLECNGYHLTLQEDGNLVLYKNGGALWATGTNGKGADQLVLQQDGNLVLYNNEEPLWSTKSDGNLGAFLQLQEDGNLVLYKNGQVLWASNTVGGQKSTTHAAASWKNKIWNFLK